MANRNLELDFRDSPGVARVFVCEACSYTKSAAPTISEDSESYGALEAEVNRLKAELDGILGDARRRFAGEPEAPEAAREKASEGTARAKPRDLSRPLAELRVEDLMTREVKTMKPEEMLSVADELMKVGRFRHVVVLDDDDEVTGVVSHRDIFHGALAFTLGQGRRAHDKALAQVPVKEVMRSRVIKIRPDAPVAEAAGAMQEHQISCLPVVDKDRLVGILTEGDFLSMLVAVR